MRQRRVVKLNRNIYCNACNKNLKNKYHSEIIFLLEIHLCPTCRDSHKSFYGYLMNTIHETRTIEELKSLLDDLRLLGIKILVNEIEHEPKEKVLVKRKK